MGKKEWEVEGGREWREEGREWREGGREWREGGKEWEVEGGREGSGREGYISSFHLLQLHLAFSGFSPRETNYFQLAQTLLKNGLLPEQRGITLVFHFTCVHTYMYVV